MKEHKNPVNCWLRGTLGVSLLAMALHSAYAFLGWSRLAMISPINESVWEHLKMGFWAVLLFGWAEQVFGTGKMRNFYPARAAEISVRLPGIVIFYYSYTAFTGTNLLWFDISSFVLCVLLGRLVACRIKRLHTLSDAWQIGAVAYLLLLVTLFAWMTYHAPDAGIFQEPSH